MRFYANSIKKKYNKRGIKVVYKSANFSRIYSKKKKFNIINLKIQLCDYINKQKKG